jgi:putative component of membrane protein insertase Oxa1/YidC/SpoIIIJ protein YidD
MKRPAAALLLAGAALLLAGAPGASAWADGAGSPGMRGPGPRAARRPPLGTRPPDYRAILRQAPEGGGSGPFLTLLELYRVVVSPVDGDRCDMAPTCSLYAQQAFREHGVVLGFLLTADRLLHEADEHPYVPTYSVRGERYYLDPVSANTYWLPEWMR